MEGGVDGDKMSAIVAGVDVGSLCTKTVIMGADRSILSFSILRSGSFYRGAAEISMNTALKSARLELSDIGYIVGTGYGRAKVPFANSQVTEISCHARGGQHGFSPRSEVISLFAEGCDKADIAAAIYQSIARRITGMPGAAGKGDICEEALHLRATWSIYLAPNLARASHGCPKLSYP